YDHQDIAWNDAKTIIDIGAHIGAFSLYAAKKSPHANIFSYEPDPVTEEYLRKNIEQNHLGHRIKSSLAAVGGTEGTATLHVLPNRSEANSMYRTLEGSHEIPVRVTTLQKIFDTENIQQCDLLKMNAEGVEYEIFYGLPPEYLKRIRVIVMNYHVFVKKPRCTQGELRAYLESNGFFVTEQGKRIFVAVRRS
ncbi:FkbM family methyltransferase, partial [Candidatus Peribacteria bacterium]|nr:FkbM family methyltransferase [Candidatus Peribacteria bacterium]